MGHCWDNYDEPESGAGLGNYGRLACRIALGVDPDDIAPAADFSRAGA